MLFVNRTLFIIETCVPTEAVFPPLSFVYVNNVR